MQSILTDNLENGLPGELNLDDSFNFECRDRCMGSCCNKIKILLDPWDVESAARHLGVTGKHFLEQYCAPEEDPNTGWIHVKLLDAEKGPCVFLFNNGRCRIYPVRSRNCRTYPVGRAVRFTPDGKKEEKFFMVRENENFCPGHNSPKQWTLKEWLNDSDSFSYYERSDLYCELINYATTTLHCRRWMNSRTAQMMMPFLYGPEILRNKLGISNEEVGHEEFYARRISALKALMTVIAAGFGFGPLAAEGNRIEDVKIMDKVKEILKNKK